MFPSTPQNAGPDAVAGSPDEVYEPLAETAPLAWSLAARGCTAAHGCQPYHGAWQYLRLLGLNTTLLADRASFIAGFRDAARSGLRRVLISCAADYGMLAQLLHAYRAEGVEPDCVMVDRCATPLRVSADYARRVGARLETVRSDVFALDLAPVDLICTHSLLSFVAPAERTTLCRVWRAMLRPGGRLVLSNTIYRSRAPDTDHRTAAAVERYRADVLAAAHAAPSLDVTPEELTAAAAALRARAQTWPMLDVEELIEPIRAAGFRLDRIETTASDDGEQGPLKASTEGKRRVFVVAATARPA